FLLHDGMNKPRVDALAHSGAKNDPIQITITGLRNVRGDRFYLGAGKNGRRKYASEIEASKTSDKENRKDGNECEPRKTQIRRKLHPITLPRERWPTINEKPFFQLCMRKARA